MGRALQFGGASGGGEIRGCGRMSCPAVIELRVSLSRQVSPGVYGPSPPLQVAGRGQAAPVSFARRTEAVLSDVDLISLLEPLQASILQMGQWGHKTHNTLACRAKGAAHTSNTKHYG